MPKAGIVARDAVYRAASADPLPTDLPGIGNIRYWFSSGHDVFSDTGGLAAARDGDSVGSWGNNGLAEDAVQAIETRRPLYREGGQNGLPYLDCDPAFLHSFDNLLEPNTTSSALSWNGWSTFAMVGQVRNIDNGSTKPWNGPLTKVVNHCLSSGTHQHGKSDWNLVDAWNGGFNWLVQSHNQLCDRRYMTDRMANAAGDSDCSNAYSGTTSNMPFLNDGAGSYFDGHVYEFIVWQNEYLTIAEMEEVGAYLATKYGTTAT